MKIWSLSRWFQALEHHTGVALAEQLETDQFPAIVTEAVQSLPDGRADLPVFNFLPVHPSYGGAVAASQVERDDHVFPSLHRIAPKLGHL